MSRYLLDTNVISNVAKPAPSEHLLAWLAQQPDDDLFISTLTIAEVRRGVLEQPTGRRRDRLEAWFAGPDGPSTLFAGRILAFDESAALVWAELMARGKATGRSRSAIDTMIAAIAVANECIVVTDNDRHFADTDHINPLRGPIR